MESQSDRKHGTRGLSDIVKISVDILVIVHDK